ncbi:Lon protease family protein [Syntrophorhabdus aromaticivorans]|uniref:Lon protease family protein n=1 Tax=Syntrophorhabdus aromaticivorans TaxID=328301 RepID=UPI00048FEB76|nr:ATP-binding protein [Syntrophorhabdus aromaticivorans]
MATKLAPEALYKPCDPNMFTFNTTDDIQGIPGTIGQEKAMRALDFGLSMDSSGFNIFALGETGTGKMTTVMTALKEKAAGEKVPEDWCYVHNFKDPDTSIAIPLDPGNGIAFQKEMDDLVKAVRLEIPKAFESKEYEMQKNRIMEEFQQKQSEYFSRLDEEAKTRGFAVKRGPTGVLIAPIRENGEPLTKEEFEALDEKARKKMEETGRMFQEKLNDVVRVLRDADKLVHDMLAKLERMVALDLVGPLIEVMKTKYKNNGKITAYLEDVKEEILSHLDEFRPTEEQPSPLPFLKMPKAEPSFAKYTVNVIVNHSDSKGAPVVFESNPTYLNLFGRIEYRVAYGMASTDFTMIKAGALHRANGGYLVIDIMDLFKNPFSYDALKRALKNREIKIEDVLEQYRMISTTGLKPEAVPLNTKVVLVGSPYIYYILYSLDEESRELFKVKADFDSRMDRTPESMAQYAGFIANCQREEKLLPFDRTGVASIIELSSRFADHQDKLSVKFSSIMDLMREAHYWAKKEGSAVVKGKHVRKAIEEKVFRVNRVEERMREMMLEDTIIVDTSGTKVGQVNGLAVLDLGDYSFGKPSRITAKTFAGKAGIVNIERETKMSGKIHEKAILIISSYLGSKYATKNPISLSASITFEQLYEMIEGDSATCAELYALLSSISGVPLKQNYAVTGSMDQNGDVQPIGGVNQKIEGFFELCKIRGLDGSQGVIIPKRNAKHLVLKQEVVEAVREGKFSIYTIDTMEEGLELLAGMPAGELQEDGTYPEGTINYLVAKRLAEIGKALEKKKEGEGNNVIAKSPEE